MAFHKGKEQFNNLKKMLALPSNALAINSLHQMAYLYI
jgi:hypothetical protein